jgi:phage gpG-like protein
VPTHWISIRLVGDQVYRRQLHRGAAAAVAPDKALDRVADDLMRVVGIQFDSEGRRGGGSWKGISSAWEERKIGAGQDFRIMHQTLKLRESMTIRDNQYQDLDISNNEITLDTTLDYADYAFSERPIATAIIPSDRDRWANWIRDGILEAMYDR